MSTFRKAVFTGALLGLFLLPVQSDAGARVYVRFGPPTVKVKIIKPIKPHRSAVWINGHYRYENSRYVWVRGSWAKPRPGYCFVQGHWKKTRRGHYYVPGRWVRI